ncbi:MAG: hypothetical protein RLZZ347_411 [Candidatus Parcubacteria bacterium]|jgi:hypothetical protein
MHLCLSIITSSRGWRKSLAFMLGIVLRRYSIYAWTHFFSRLLELNEKKFTLLEIYNL